jgi:hypothetical protein
MDPFSERDTARKLGLRFDKVATRLAEDLHATLEAAIPARSVVLITITAPIRTPAKTATLLQEKIIARLNGRPTSRDAKLTVCGNAVRIRVLTGMGSHLPRLICLVHNADRDSRLLMDFMAQQLDSDMASDND